MLRCANKFDIHLGSTEMFSLIPCFHLSWISTAAGWSDRSTLYALISNESRPVNLWPLLCLDPRTECYFWLWVTTSLCFFWHPCYIMNNISPTITFSLFTVSWAQTTLIARTAAFVIPHVGFSHRGGNLNEETKKETGRYITFIGWDTAAWFKSKY